jgi:hypothetical protein
MGTWHVKLRSDIAPDAISASQVSLDNLWKATSPSKQFFDPGRLNGLPQGARLYLQHAIKPGTPLASAVRLRMHGEIKLNAWYPFSAEQVIAWERGFIWQATVRMRGIPVRGSDRFIDGEGHMRWKLLGLLPLMSASGPDISRSAAGRINLESIWLPSTLAVNNTSWEDPEESHLQAQFTAHGEEAKIDCRIECDGRLRSINMPRWGNPGGLEFDYYNCGGLVEEEKTFGGYTIPSGMRVGWHFGTELFDSEGEFFRVTIDDASYR